MISIYFLHLPHLVQCYFSSTRRTLLSFQPMGDMFEFCLEITKQEDCLFIRVVYWDSRNLGSFPTLTVILFLTFGEMLYFSTLLKTALLFCYPVWIVKPHLKKRDTISFLLPILLPDYTAVSAWLGLFPTRGLYRVCDTMELWYSSKPLDITGLLILVQLLALRSQKYWGKVICDSSKIKSWTPSPDKTLPATKMSGFSHKYRRHYFINQAGNVFSVMNVEVEPSLETNLWQKRNVKPCLTDKFRFSIIHTRGLHMKTTAKEGA